MANDLSKMSRKQLEKLLKDVQSAIAEHQAKERKEAKKAAEAAAAKYGFSLSELTENAAKSRKGRPKNPGTPRYVNPEDPTQTWTGKGRQPQWFKDAVAAGTDPKSLEI